MIYRCQRNQPIFLVCLFWRCFSSLFFVFFVGEKHLIKNGCIEEEGLPLFDEGMESVKEMAPIASPDFSISGIVAEESVLGLEVVQETQQPKQQNKAQLEETSYPAFHSVQSEYHSSQSHIEPFYRYRVYSDASWSVTKFIQYSSSLRCWETKRRVA